MDKPHLLQGALRPAQAADYPAILDLADAAVPFDREGNRRWLRKRQQFDEVRQLRRHYVALSQAEGEICGYGALEEQGSSARQLRVYVVTAAERLADVGSLLYQQLEQDAQTLQVSTLWAQEHARDQALQDFFAVRGFVETGRVWDLRLPLKEARLSVFLPRVDEVAANGVHISALAEEGPDSLPRLFDLVRATWPTHTPPPTYEQFRQWLEQDDVFPDVVFVARREGQYVGYSALTRSDVEPGWLIHTRTAVRPQFRRQGVTLALRVSGIQYAQRAGYETVVTYNDAENFTVLALDDKLGFRRVFEYVSQRATIAKEEDDE